MTEPQVLPETTPQRQFSWPADYYSTAAPVAILPSWAALGCGAAAVVVLIIVFAGGAWLSTGGHIQVMDLSLGMTVGEMKGMYAPDVPPPQRKSLEDEIEKMREGLREEKVAVTSLQPFMQELQKAAADEKITAAEAKSLEDTVRRVNSLAKK